MSKLIWQNHHIIYSSDKNKELIVRIIKGEHMLLSLLSRRKNHSEGFIKALKIWIAINEDNTIEEFEKLKE